MTANRTPDLPEGASDAMRDYRNELVDAVRLANTAYDDISTADMVAVFRHRADLYETFGRAALHPRNRAERDDIPHLDGTFVERDDGAIDSTDRRWFDVDIGFKTGLMHGTTLTDEEAACVCESMADHLDAHGRASVGRRPARSE